MDYDFCIIGGGIAGLSAAAKLSELGPTVLCEAEAHLAYHASGRSAALYEPFYGPPPVVALSHASGDALRDAGVLSPRGVLVVGGKEDGAAFDRDVTTMSLTPITADEAAGSFALLDPRKIAFAAKGPHAFDIDTDLLIQTYQKIARGRGATILTQAAVTALAPTGHGWQVTTAKGVFTARQVINAAGAWAERIGQLAGALPIHLTPKRRSMARIAVPDGMDPACWPMVFGAGETWYAKPDAGALIVSPADAEPTHAHDAWADDLVLAEGLARYEAMSRHPVTRLLANWAGLRTFAPDGLPVVGPDPQAKGFWWLAGQGGYGFQSAPAIAALLAGLVNGQATDPDLTAALCPARFSPDTP